MSDPIDRLTDALKDRYRLERELGQGGMATVYLAQDLKHNRKVAIKVLKPELAAVIGGERFVQEIATTAALQHPNILPLFDSGSADTFLFYVMPFVEGETLRARLDRSTQLGVDESVKLVSEVADALDYAHRHGVVHRDIKPENILIHEGRPMVADFGIAIAVSAAAGGRMTETGLSLGTPHYMSPEQATAEKNIDARSDIYSLGAVLYEMLSGDPPHVGASVQQIIMKIVTEDAAPVTKTRRSVPPNVAAAVATALERLPADRFESARDFAAALQNPAFRGTGATVARMRGAPGIAHAGPRARLRDPFVVGPWLAALAAIVVAVVLARRPAPAAPALPPIRFLLATSDSVSPFDNGPWPGAISPDGGTVVFSGAGPDHHLMLYSLRTNELDARPIPGTENGTQPYFSPDGAWVGFEQNGLERKVRLDGTSPVTIAGGGVANNGATWTPGGKIVIGSFGHFAGLVSVSAAGGQPVPLTHVDSAHGERAHYWPIATPDPNTVIFAIWYGNLGSAKLAAAAVDNGHVTPLGISGVRPLAVVDGRLVYVQADGTVMAVPFDLRHLRVTGSPTPVHDPVAVLAGSNGNAEVFVSNGGGLVSGRARASARLVWAARDGAVSPVSDQLRDYTLLALSPDGRRIAAEIADDHGSDVWIQDLDSPAGRRITTLGTVRWVSWTHDGSGVVYVSLDSASQGSIVWLQNLADGSPPQKLYEDPTVIGGTVLSPDGKSLIVNSYQSSWKLFRVPLDSGSAPAARAYVATGSNANYPAFSPDGRWVAYMSDETGQTEVYVRSFPDPATTVPVSTGGGVLPQWSPDGTHLYYAVLATGKLAVISVRVALSPTFRIVSRDTLTTLSGGVSNAGVFVSPDGKRVVYASPVSSAFQIFVAPNWSTEMRRRLAGAGGDGTH